MRKLIESLLFVSGILCAVIVFAQPAQTNASPFPPPIPHPGYSNVKIYERWEPTTTPGSVASQCNYRAHGEIITGFGEWSDVIRIATNNSPGGCQFQLAIIDPDGAMKDWRLKMKYEANGIPGQCGNLGIHDVPVVKTIAQARAEAPIIIMDTDLQAGGCLLSFDVGSPGPKLAVYFEQEGSHGSGDDGCWMTGQKIAKPGKPAQIGINTDDYRSPCILQFSIFSLEHELRSHYNLSSK
ncbi:hypothetical protein [Ralstonia solanacearum]|uniref:hypothetical protein n=1 Tax=Ralstonia solanacearum TaxID=305 RepID=UPI000B196147|nr:hypothetical protein [Ralstonia solanacearum]